MPPESGARQAPAGPATPMSAQQRREPIPAHDHHRIGITEVAEGQGNPLISESVLPYNMMMD